LRDSSRSRCPPTARGSRSARSSRSSARSCAPPPIACPRAWATGAR